MNRSHRKQLLGAAGLLVASLLQAPLLVKFGGDTAPTVDAEPRLPEAPLPPLVAPAVRGESDVT